MKDSYIKKIKKYNSGVRSRISSQLILQAAYVSYLDSAYYSYGFFLPPHV